MKQFLKNHLTKIKFVAIGSINTIIDIGLLFLFVNLFGIPKVIANIISTSIAFIFSFFANKTFTFKSLRKTKRELAREFITFAVVTLFGLWIVQGIIIYLITPSLKTVMSGNIALFIAKLIATAASLIWNYILYSRVVFKDRNRQI